jgi:hypothetical protein
MIKRSITATVKRLARSFPVVAITGPRQSGKTTLARSVFPHKAYLSLEDLDIRELAEKDPRRFLSSLADGAILDEVQRVPSLFSYLQTHVDQNLHPGMFILTGSQQFGLLSGISQSLAGRVGMVQLLPFSFKELAAAKKLPSNPDAVLFRGCYPPLYDRKFEPGDWFSSYVATYIERDVRQLLHLRDLSAFQRFVKMCAARTGQLLNLSSLANDCGITHNTAGAWVSILEASYIIHLLRPHSRNFNKRLVKTPKLYFHDVGLAASLLGIRKQEDIVFHSMRGSLFETMIVSEFLKERFNSGRSSNLFFWRDSRGLEIDLLLEEGEHLQPIEIKSGATITSDYPENLMKWVSLSDGKPGKSSSGQLVYGGSQAFTDGEIRFIPWNHFPERI